MDEALRLESGLHGVAATSSTLRMLSSTDDLVGNSNAAPSPKNDGGGGGGAISWLGLLGLQVLTHHAGGAPDSPVRARLSASGRFAPAFPGYRFLADTCQFGAVWRRLRASVGNIREMVLKALLR